MSVDDDLSNLASLRALLQRDGTPEPQAAFVCLGDDEAGLRATLQLRSVLAERIQIVVCTTGRSDKTDLLDLVGGMPNVEGFALLDRVCSPQVLLNTLNEALAQSTHANYVRREKEAGTPLDDPSMALWEHLSESLRESNRAQAYDLGKKMNEIGCSIVRPDDWNETSTVLTDGEVELLARAEHERWMDERRRDGWTFGTRRDVDAKVTPFLVPWEELEEIVRDKDRNSVRDIPEKLAEAGFVVVRDKALT